MPLANGGGTSKKKGTPAMPPEKLMRILMPSLFALVVASGLWAQSIAPRDGWVIVPTRQTPAALLDSLAAAVKANGMGVVTQAGPTAAARSRGITIPENRVVGVFNNDFAVEVLTTSTAAMIEAPIRFYVTEEADGTATLSRLSKLQQAQRPRQEASNLIRRTCRDT